MPTAQQKLLKFYLQLICKCKINTYIRTHKKGLVAQLNSASDYGSEGYWFESSRGHLRKQKAFQSQIETAFHLDYGAHSGHVIQSQNFNSDSNSIAIETAFHLDYGAHSG